MSFCDVVRRGLRHIPVSDVPAFGGSLLRTRVASVAAFCHRTATHRPRPPLRADSRRIRRVVRENRARFGCAVRLLLIGPEDAPRRAIADGGVHALRCIHIKTYFIKTRFDDISQAMNFFRPAGGTCRAPKSPRLFRCIYINAHFIKTRFDKTCFDKYPMQP